MLVNLACVCAGNQDRACFCRNPLQATLCSLARCWARWKSNQAMCRFYQTRQRDLSQRERLCRTRAKTNMAVSGMPPTFRSQRFAAAPCGMSILHCRSSQPACHAVKPSLAGDAIGSHNLIGGADVTRNRSLLTDSSPCSSNAVSASKGVFHRQPSKEKLTHYMTRSTHVKCQPGISSVICEAKLSNSTVGSRPLSRAASDETGLTPPDLKRQ